ncbi:MAG: NAD-dependent succinate-semialdehyde dehydrogenase [Propionibacteriaceae bacterium]|nr:NAD-dependent succinate-semialdehyde dehydrogenase [Propionibacteriaceae bacterium]
MEGQEQIRRRALQALAAVPTGCLVGEGFGESSSGRNFGVENPATGQELTQVADCDHRDGERALDAACAAQWQWADTAPRQRAELLRALHEHILARREEFAAVMTLEMGKPLAEARAEVAYGAEFLRWFSEEAVRINGRTTLSPEGSLRIWTMKRAVGPVLAITPWNFPLAMATRKLGPALAAGCVGILKPSVLTPLTALAFGAACLEVGIPAGVVQVLPTSDAPAVTAPMIRDRRLRKLSFTGSTTVGKQLLREAAGNVLRTSMELGGCAPFIVFEDADLDRALEAARITKLRNIGEACNAANTFYVHRSLAEEFAERLAVEFDSLTVGDGLCPEVQVGPLISAQQLHRVQGLLDEAMAGGARILTRGEVPGEGYFLRPTVVAGVGAEAAIAVNEIFGPVAPVVPFDDEAEVLAWANASPVGLAGYVHTASIERALRMAERLEVGMIGINSATTSNVAAPFGGVKHSGLGREGGSEGIEEYLETVYVGLPTQP